MRRIRLLTSGALAMALVLTPAATANAAPPNHPGFADVDSEAMTRQFNRLEAFAAAHAEGAGGTYFDEATGQLVVRQVANVDGGRLRAQVMAAARQPGDVAVRFETTSTPIKRLIDATASLKASRDWAGVYAGSIHHVYLNMLTPQIVISASGDADGLIAAAQAATGLAVRVQISKDGGGPLSRRADTVPYFGGLAMWNQDLFAAGLNPHTTTAYCTTGFRMTRGGTNSNWVTTAGHCGPNQTLFWHNGAWSLRVSSNYYSSGTDIAMLAGEGGAYFSKESWFGGTDTTTHYPVTAKNTTWPAIGSAVYFNGANGGQIYGVVVNVNDRSICPQPMVLVDTITGHPNDGIAQHGDSGGPVTRWNTATPAANDLAAVGSITCGDGEMAQFEPIHLIEQATGSVVVVGGT